MDRQNQGNSGACIPVNAVDPQFGLLQYIFENKMGVYALCKGVKQRRLVTDKLQVPFKVLVRTYINILSCGPTGIAEKCAGVQMCYKSETREVCG